LCAPVEEGEWTVYDLAGYKIASGSLINGCGKWDFYSTSGESSGNGAHMFVMVGYTAEGTEFSAKGTLFHNYGTNDLGSASAD
jgi:hypothetical protein